MKAAIVSGSSGDYILLEAGYKLGLEEISFSEFMQETEKKGDFSEWDSYYRWDEEFDNIESAIESFGTLICYVDDRSQFVIKEAEIFEQKSEYYEDILKKEFH